MIVKLSNQIFKHPRSLYNEWNISDEEWKKIIYHFRFLEYKQSELHEYIRVIMKKDIPSYTMSRLLIRDQLYVTAEALRKRGELEVHIQQFRPYENFVRQYYD